MRHALAAALLATVTAIAPAWGRSPGQEALDEGVAKYKVGSYKDALASFRRAVDLDPSLTKAWENLGWAQHRLGDDRDALRVWQTVLKLEPANVACWNAVGEVQLARGAWGDARSAFLNSLALEPDQPDVGLRLGQAYEKLDRLDEAAAQYRAILERRPGDSKATTRLADLEESRGDLSTAEEVLRAGLARSSDSGDAITTRLARVIAKRGDEAYRAGWFDEAAGAYREAVSLDSARASYLANLGWAERRGGNDADAVAVWKQAISRGAAHPAELWRAVGDAERDAGRLAEARDAYRRAAAADPHAEAALYSLATISLDAGDPLGAVPPIREMMTTGGGGKEDAVRAADLFIRYDAIETGQAVFEGLAANPAHEAAAHAALGRLYAARGGAAYRAGSDSEAAAFYGKALAADPANRAALRDFGWTLWRGGDWAGVRDVWGRYLATYPELAEPHELMGRLELQHGSPRKAVEEAHAALAIEPDALSPNVLLTKAYLAEGKFRHARELGAELAIRHPDDLAVQTLYGETLWRSLDFEAASVQWRKVIDMGGGTPRAMHYWLRSLYETGAYDEAVAAAQAAAARGSASEPVVRLLAEDALVRGDDQATLRWYRELTERFPQRVPYWVALAETYRAMEKFRSEERVLDAAFARHPSSPEIGLLQADAELSRERPASALDLYRALGQRLGSNRTVFEGELQSLRRLGADARALSLLRETGPHFLDANERALHEASILEDMGRRTEAARIRQHVIDPPAGTVELPILLYHGLSEKPRSLNLPLDRFEGEMEAIREAGYTAITVSEVDAMLSGRMPFPEKPIAITFDDARADSFRYADPILERLGLKATMFVPTIRIADESAFSTDWESLRRLAATGRWDFQAHGHLAHDPIPVDEKGELAEFLVNRQWLAEEHRLETHDEFAARVADDYRTCLELIAVNVPGQAVVAYAFPFSEFGQLHGGNDPGSLVVNQQAFEKLYRYGFVQDSSGFNTLTPGESRRPLLLNRLNVDREWDAHRLMAILASQSPAERAKLDGARADVANLEYRDAESDLRRTIAEKPQTYPESGIVLATDLHEQEREREARRAYELVPSGPAWGRPDASQRKLARDISWETDPQAGGDLQIVSDSDHRDTIEALATGRYPFEAPVDLWGSVGSAQFRDAEFPSLSGIEGTLGVDWAAARRVKIGGWLRGRSLNDGVGTIEGEGTFGLSFDGHRFGGACGVTDVETVGAFQDEIQKRGCRGAYDLTSRTWRARLRLALNDLTDGNAVAYGWADGTVDAWKRFRISVGGRLELGDSRTTSTLYYAPTGLVSLLAIVRYAHSFPAGTAIEAEAGAGPSRSDTTSTRIIGQAQLAWTQDWGVSWRSRLTAEYGATPDYHRTALGFSFGYRF